MLEEETVHAGGIAWLTQNRNYRELFEDPDESTNARLDSVGLMAERLCLIEVKVSVGPREARHIESKLSGSFRGHADPTNGHPQFIKMRELWDGRCVPLVATLARNYTLRGLTDLIAMLQGRAAEWGFDFEIWQWSDNEMTTLGSGVSGIDGQRDPRAYIETVAVRKSNRSKPATLDELRAIADANGVLSIFEHALNSGNKLGLKAERRKSSVTITLSPGSGLIRLLPQESDATDGLLVDCIADVGERLEAIGLKHLGPGVFTYERFVVPDVAAMSEVLQIAVASAKE